jgi:enoyl-CoA hydratase
MTDYVRYELKDGIANLTMDDGKANAFGPSMSEAINAALDRASAEAKAILISGKPGLLSGGFDLKIINNGTPDERAAMLRAGAELMIRLYLHPQPLIIANTGHAVALGAIMLFTADYRIAAAGDFKIGMNETAIGLSLPTFAVELARDRLDGRQLTQATAGATLYSPEAATTVGYHDEVVSADDLTARAQEKAVEMATLSPAGFAEVKSRLRLNIANKIRASFAAEFAA